MTGFRKLAEEELLRGSLISVARGTFESPSGQVFHRELVHHPGAVVIVPVVEDQVILVRQYRAAVDSLLLELPAGRRDVSGEPPEKTAARELMEEVGQTAGRLELLGRFYNSPGFCDELSWLFLATDLIPGERAPAGIEEQSMFLEEVPLSAALEMVRRGEIVDAKTIIGLSMASVALASRSR